MRAKTLTSLFLVFLSVLRMNGEDATPADIPPTSIANEEIIANLNEEADNLAKRIPEVANDKDRAELEQMLAGMKEQQEKLMQQQEELKRLTNDPQEAPDSDVELASREDFPKPKLEKITKKDGTSFYTQIVSSEDQPTPLEEWPEEYDMPPAPSKDDKSSLAVPSKQGPTRMFTMPANRDMKEVLKEIMANDGDVRKVPGLKPWKPSDDKRNRNQIGSDDTSWDDADGASWDDAGNDEDAWAEDVEENADGTGVVPRDQGAATSLADANHQISMMKIDLATLKQEKAMKEKSASLQISNLKQKLAGTQRVLEDLKISSKRDNDDARDLRRRVDELEEQLESARRDAAAKKDAEDQLAALKAEVKAAESKLAEKESTIDHWKAENADLVKAIALSEEENAAKDKEWNSRWMERQQSQEAAMSKWQDESAQNKKKVKKMAKKLEKVEEDMKVATASVDSMTLQLRAASEASKQLEDQLATTTADLAAAKAAEAATAEAAAASKAESEKNRSSLEEAIASLNNDKELMKREAEAAAEAALKVAAELEAKVAAELEAKVAAKAEVDSLRIQSQTYLPALIGLIGIVTTLLLYNCLRSCCCGGGAKKTTAAASERDPDVKSSKTEEISEPVTKKSKKGKKE